MGYTTHHCFLLPAAMLSALLLSACTDNGKTATTGQAADPAELPAPARNSGSITGMPDKPRPKAPVAVTGQAPVETAPVVDGDIDGANPETGLLPGAAPTVDGVATGDASTVGVAAEPTADDAAAVINDYYASIDSRSYARAYSLWSDAGRGSGQSPEQFADGFADTVRVAVEAQAPGEIDAAAGSRFIAIPVAVKATHADGSVHHYTGRYTLRRAVVEGASAEQRAWRIASAELSEAKP